MGQRAAGLGDQRGEFGEKRGERGVEGADDEHGVGGARPGPVPDGPDGPPAGHAPAVTVTVALAVGADAFGDHRALRRQPEGIRQRRRLGLRHARVEITGQAFAIEYGGQLRPAQQPYAVRGGRN